MIALKTRWILAGLLSLSFWSAFAWAGAEEWQSHMDAGVEAYVDGDHAEAGKQFGAAVNEAEAFGADDPRLAESLNGLAVVYREQGRYTEAEPLLKRALAIREKALGPAHSDVIQSLSNLAGLYQTQGRHADAEPLLKRVRDLEPRTTVAEPLFGSVQGLELPSFGQSPELMEAFNSSITLYQQGRYSEAEPYAKEALRLGTEEFGPNAPSTAALLNELAPIYQAQGRYAEAEPLFQRSLAIREKAHGTEHPHVATSLNNLAALYRAQGRYAEAEPLFQRSLAIWEKTLGPEHQHVAKSVNNMAHL